MTSRERVLSAINHHEPDGVPVDMGSTPSSGISAIAYSNLLKHLGINDCGVKIYDVVQELAIVDDEIIDMFDIDVIDVGRVFNTNVSDWYPVSLSNGNSAYYPTWFKPVKNNETFEVFDPEGTKITMKPKGANFFDQVYFPYIDSYPSDLKSLSKAMSKVHWAALTHSPWDHLSDSGFWESLRHRTMELRENTNKALMIAAGCNLFEWGTFLRRIDNFLMDIYLEPDHTSKLLDALVEIHLENLEKICFYVGDLVDIIRLGDDLGATGGPFMGADTYRNVFKPRHKILTQYIKDNSQAHTFLHSCGSIYNLIPELIDAGFEIINPVQTSAYNMDPKRLKKRIRQEYYLLGRRCRYPKNTELWIS